MTFSGAERVAVLDMDGTLLPGFLGVRFLEALSAHTDPAAVTAALAAVVSYRRGDTDLSTAAPLIYRHYADALKGVATDVVDAVADTVWQAARPHLFPFVAELLVLLDRHGYRTLLISGSPDEVVTRAGTDLAVSAARGVIAETAGGRYTGELVQVPGLPGGKHAALADLTAGRTPDLAASLAIGDASADAEIFHRVGLPVAFEPDPELRRLAAVHRWIVADRRTLLPVVRELVGGHVTSTPPEQREPR